MRDARLDARPEGLTLSPPPRIAGKAPPASPAARRGLPSVGTGGNDSGRKGWPALSIAPSSWAEPPTLHDASSLEVVPE